LKYGDEEIYTMFESYDINKLDINRIYRYLDKYTNKDCKVGGDDITVIDVDNYADEMAAEGGSEDY
jgi:hypothetical protein